MNMTSRFTLLAGVAGAIWAGCSSPAGEGDIAPAPTTPPPGIASGQAGAGQQLPQGGTGGGGGAPVVTAGTGGSGGAAGAGGSAMAAAGAGGGGGTIPTGSGNIIMHDDLGWVAGSSNGLGIQGSFYTISDADGTPPGVTQIALGDFTVSPTSTCVSGTASAVPDNTGYAQYWGGGLALNLSDPGGGMPVGAWAPGSVTGFSFTVTGATIPPGLRFNAVDAAGTTFCGDLAAGANTVSLTALNQTCYNETPGAALAASAPLESIQWQIVTVLTDATPFDFCIENLTALGG